MFWLLVPLAKASPISSMVTEALMPVLIVTIMLIGANDVLPAKDSPMGKAIRVTVFNGGGTAVQIADNGAVPRTDVV